MSLRIRLIYLLAAFAAFVVVAASVTVYGTLVQLADAMVSFNRSMNQTDDVERLRITAREQIIELRDIVDGRCPITPEYLASREEFFTKLEQLARFAPAPQHHRVWQDILEVGRELQSETAECLDLVKNGLGDEARHLLQTRIESVLLEVLKGHLNAAVNLLGESANEPVRDLLSTSDEVLLLATVVGALATGLMIVGASLIRRWLIVPITTLREATQRFSAGDLDYRVSLPRRDELGGLGDALNSMAVSLTQAQAELHTSEAKYRELFENLRDAVVICDISGRVVECHDGDTQILDTEHREHIDRHLLEAWPEWRSDQLQWDSLIKRVITTGKRFSATDVVLDRDGERDPAVVDLIAYPVAYNNAQFAAIVLRDVTERVRLQSRMRHADKMEATGTLAGGLAHDFNNLLTSAIGTLSLLSNEITDERQSDLVQTALRASWQAAGLSRRLLDFASGGYRRPEVLRLREVVELVLNSLDESVFEGVKVVTECINDVLVRADRDQLSQIILNLVRNACDAMETKGELRVTVDEANTSDPAEGSSNRPYGVLTVKDTGGGMTPEVLERLFEPFFTTKTRASHRGRGLGLAIVYASVKSSGGFIQVDSQLGVGTTFRIHLPIGEGVPATIEPPTYAAPAQKGEGSILVVDDEPLIVQMCVRAMEKWGYSVISADSIADAAHKFDSARDDIALALIDINLPDGSGVLLAEDLVTLNPKLRIVFATGYSDAKVSPELEGNVCGRLCKPFALDELVNMLSTALAPASPRE